MRTAQARRSRATQARKAVSSRASHRKLSLEPLESRALLAARLLPEDGLSVLSGHGGACQCPVCTGVGLGEIPVVMESTTTTTTSTPLSGLPQLSSNPGARKKLFLDFNGHVQSSWGSFTSVVTPAFDQNGSPSSLSSGELASIREIWTRVAEDYSPFNIDVTTIDPGTSADGVVARLAIGGHYSDWYESAAGGVAYVGGFTNSMPNVAYVFEDALGNGNPRYVAEAAAHEAGHLFGLAHQAVWNGGTLVEAYNSGAGNWAPIMGTGYYAERTTWHRGPTPASSTAIQDDMSLLGGVIGWRGDDFASAPAGATALSTGTSVYRTGVIGSPSDVDLWSFTTTGGAVNLQLTGALYGGNLDAVLELRSSSGQIIVTAAPSTSLGASLSRSLSRGTYYVAVRGGVYGNAGQYTLRGTLPPGATSATTLPPPETTTPPPTTTTTTLVKRVLDNGATGYASSGAWTTRTGVGVASDISVAARGTGTCYATWSFTSIPSGSYQVYGAWTGASTNATNAPFTLYNGSTPVATVRASQRVNSAGVTAEGTTWKLLGTVTVSAGRLNVRLTNQADGAVVADAIRIVQLSAAPAGAEVMSAELLVWPLESESEPVPAQSTDSIELAGSWLPTMARPQEVAREFPAALTDEDSLVVEKPVRQSDAVAEEIYQLLAESHLLASTA